MKIKYFLIVIIIFSSATIYAQNWEKISNNQPTPRAYHNMSMVIGTDKIVLFGGVNFNELLDDTWIFDLSANTWTFQNNSIKPSARAVFTMSYIGDDKVLLFGGDDDTDLLNDTWIYDLSANTWTELNPLVSPSARGYHAMSYIGDDKVLLFGGEDDIDLLNDTWIFDLSENTWTEQSPSTIPIARYGHSLSYIANGKAIMFGGDDDTDLLNDTWLYDLDAENWILQSPLNSPSARAEHSSSFIYDDKIILFGGNDDTDLLNDTWVYDLSDNTWTEKNPTESPEGRLLSSIAYIGDDKAILFGGYNYSFILDDTDIYDLSEDDWTLEYSSIVKPYGGESVCYAGNEQLVLFGGVSFIGYDLSNKTYIFDNNTTEWELKNPTNPPNSRYFHSACYIGDDKVLLFGGDDDTDLLNDTWIYDVSDNTWTEKNPSTQPIERRGHKLSYIGGDKAILFGGEDDANPLDDTWVYDLSDNTWTNQNPSTSPSARYLHNQSYLSDGKVLLFGGDDDTDLLNDTWLYDINTNIWTLLTPATSPPVRYASSMDYIGNNSILLFGGDGDVDYLNDTWIYNYDINNWEEITITNTPSKRYFNSLSTLSNGKILLHGGVSSTIGILNDDWIFHASPILSTSNIQIIGDSKAKSGGEITDEGESPITQKGVCWNTSGSPTMSDNYTNDGSGDADYESIMNGLTVNTQYYVRAYATNSNGTGYGDEISFTFITTPDAPIVSNATFNTLKVSIANDGNSLSTQYFIQELNTNRYVQSNGTLGTTPVWQTRYQWGSKTVTGLTSGSEYRFRVKARNNDTPALETNYSAITLKKTLSNLPTIYTNDIRYNGESSAKSGGTIVDEGASEITQKGIVWNTSGNPTLEDNEGYTEEGSGDEDFISIMTNLELNEKYYVRAYATNNEGTGYGDQKTYIFRLIPTLPEWGLIIFGSLIAVFAVRKLLS